MWLVALAEMAAVAVEPTAGDDAPPAIVIREVEPAVPPSADVPYTVRGTVVPVQELQQIPMDVMWLPALEWMTRLWSADPPTVRLGGVDVSDPLTGGNPLHLDPSWVEDVTIALGPSARIAAGAGRQIDVALRHPSTTRDAEVGAGRTMQLGDGNAADRLWGTAAGPIVRDHAFAAAGVRADIVRPLAYTSQAGWSTVRIQPDTRWRIHATGLWDGSDRNGVPQRHGIGLVRLQWWPNETVAVEGTASVQSIQVGGASRSRRRADVALTGIGVQDPWGGVHDVQVGADVEHVSWSLGPQPDLAPTLADGVDATRVGWFVEDAWRPAPRLGVAASLRADHAFARTHLGPRASLSWDPTGRGRTLVSAGWGRWFGSLGLAAGDDHRRLGRTDEGFLVAHRALSDLVTIGAQGTLRGTSRAPRLGQARVDHRALLATVFLERAYANRVVADVSWTYAATPWSSDASTPAPTGHQVQVSAAWELPTYPVPATLGGSAALVVARSDSPLWRLAARWDQQFDLRRGAASIRTEVGWITPGRSVDDPLAALAMQGPVPGQSWSGPRVGVHLRYTN